MYSITYWANNFAIAIGGVLGGFLFSDYLFQLLIALSIVSGIDIVIIIFFITESYKPTTKKLQPTKHLLNLTKNYKMVVKDRIFIFFVLGGVLIYSMELQLTNYIGIKISNNIHEQQYFNWTLDGVNVLGILRSENTILAVIFILVIPSLIKLVKDKILLIISCTVFSIGYGIISYSNNISTLIIIMSITTLAEVLRVPIEKSYLATIPPDDGRSTYMAIAGLKHNFSMLIVSMTVILPSYFSSLSITFIITFIGLIGTFIYFLTIPMIEKRSE